MLRRRLRGIFPRANLEASRRPARRISLVAITGIRRTARAPAVLVILSAALDGAFVVRVPSDAAACFVTKTLAMLLVAAGAGGGGFLEEEVEEFVADGEVGLLLELLERGETEKGLEEGEGCSDVVEHWIRDCRRGDVGWRRRSWA